MRNLNLRYLMLLTFFCCIAFFTYTHSQSIHTEKSENFQTLLDFVDISDFNYSNKNKINETLIVDSILIGACQEKGSPCFEDSQPSEFYTIIKLTNMGSLIQNWKFGFYMPRSFDKLIKTNNRLAMNICDATKSCKNLRYVKEKENSLNDQSAGYTTVLEPESEIDLRPGSQYEIHLIRNNQWIPKNYSAVPQSLFLVVTENEIDKVYNLSTQKSTYTFLEYDQKQIYGQIKEHNMRNWEASSEMDSNNILIPSPVSYKEFDDEKEFYFKNGLRIQNDFTNLNPWVVDYFQNILKKDLNINTLSINDKKVKAEIHIRKILNSKDLNENREGYRLTIANSTILIEALHDSGVFYAIQSLRQLWNEGKKSFGLTYLHPVSIKDYPRFKYRGVVLDVSRHYFSIQEMKNIIEIMATHKLNSLHLHLADDEGFRIQLKDFPELSTIGDVRAYGKRQGPLMFIQGNLDSANYKNKIYPNASTVYSKTYSRNDLKEIVEYANKYQITVIPEIEFPGHARAMMKSLPNLFYDKNDSTQFISAQGYSDNVVPVCSYNENSQFGVNFTNTVHKILKEIVDIFSHQKTLGYISNEVSIGGDEVTSNAWEESRSCQQDWLNLSSLEKSHKFFKEISNNLPELKLSGWQQFVQNEDESLGFNRVDSSKTGHVWVWNTFQKGIQQAANLANNNYPVVVAFADQTYFDLAYTPDKEEPGFSWATSFSDTQSSLQSAVTSKITMDLANNPENIVGIEATLWSENLASYEHLIYMALPKMSGLAEASWSSLAMTTTIDNKVNWKSLSKRLNCGSKGFLNFINKVFNVRYRGFPNGIYLETPDELCNN